MRSYFLAALVLGALALVAEDLLFAQVAPPVVVTAVGPTAGLFNGAYVQVAPAPKVLAGSYVLACAPATNGVMQLFVWYGDPEVYGFYYLDAKGAAVPITYSVGGGRTATCAAWICLSSKIYPPYGAHDCCPSFAEMQTHLVKLAATYGYTNVALPRAN